MNTNKKLNEEEILEEYYTGDELSELETEVLAGKVEDKITRNKSRIMSFLSHIKALSNYLFDKDVKWYRKSVVAAALIYFVTPIDSIPDLSPFVGFLDDLGVIAAVVKFMGSELKKYYD
jgi:uncharacterized membrane protein YkvA (DUF1232 family)